MHFAVFQNFLKIRRHTKSSQEMMYCSLLTALENLRHQTLCTNGLGHIISIEFLFIRFFKWLYHPNLEQKKRPKPEVIENIALVRDNRRI